MHLAGVMQAWAVGCWAVHLADVQRLCPKALLLVQGERKADSAGSVAKNCHAAFSMARLHASLVLCVSLDCAHLLECPSKPCLVRCQVQRRPSPQPHVGAIERLERVLVVSCDGTGRSAGQHMFTYIIVRLK